ncbi:MAG TPA: TMEM175 family protein [Pyrinomonadaceae bacterium]
MLRNHLIAGARAGELGETSFRWRGAEITRLEGFTDAVFAFAVTLLVVSLEVPQTFHELMEAMRGFAAFGVCFALLANVWFNHYRFFRRYGLQDPWAVFLNCVLLFFVLFYVYPLKFLFVTMFNSGGRIEAQEARTLFIIYGAGYAAVFLVFALLHLHAWRKRQELALNQLEQMKTRHSLVDHVAMVIVGLVSVLLALSLPLRWVGLAGYFYFVIGVYFTLAGRIFGKRERLLTESMRAASPAAGISP